MNLKMLVDVVEIVDITQDVIKINLLETIWNVQVVESSRRDKMSIENLKIGDTFKLGDREFKIKKDTSKEIKCEDCFFFQNDLDCELLQVYSILPQCCKETRKDNKDVIFVEK